MVRARGTDGFVASGALKRLVVFLLALGSSAYFIQGAGANQNSRFDLVRAIVEEGTFRIDSFHRNTFDKSVHEGHYFTDKAPGLSFAAVVPYAAMHAVHRSESADAEPNPVELHLLTLATVSLVSATI
jgi:hypothetical protein